MEGDREKAHALIDAYFDGKDITMFCKNVNKYKIVEDNENSEGIV